MWREILTINEKYDIYIFNTVSDDEFIESAYSFNNIKYPELNDFLITSGYKAILLNFEINGKNFRGTIDKYGSTWENRTVKDFKNINIDLDKDIYGFDNDDIKAMKMDLKEYITSTTYGHMVIRKVK